MFHGGVVLADAPSRPIAIGERIWVGCDAKNLKGVTIGDDSVVGVGAVVTGSFAVFSLIAGCPARVVKKTRGWGSQRRHECW